MKFQMMGIEYRNNQAEDEENAIISEAFQEEQDLKNEIQEGSGVLFNEIPGEPWAINSWVVSQGAKKIESFLEKETTTSVVYQRMNKLIMNNQSLVQKLTGPQMTFNKADDIISEILKGVNKLSRIDKTLLKAYLNMSKSKHLPSEAMYDTTDNITKARCKGIESTKMIKFRENGTIKLADANKIYDNSTLMRNLQNVVYYIIHNREVVKKGLIEKL